ncbi:MAG: FAD-binding protein [Clostridiales bacterium]|nr:FAD-binding protein [Clostridiales bacterium]
MENFKTIRTDVLVIGGGGAACRAAIEASNRGRSVIMIDKDIPGKSGATPCAFWSIQAPMGKDGQSTEDTPEQFFEDMVNGGHYFGDQNITELVAFTAKERIFDMKKYGVKFAFLDDGRFVQTPMPGQTYPRSCFMIANGTNMSTHLAKEVSRRENIRVLKDHLVFRLLTNGGQAVGGLALDQNEGGPVVIEAVSTVLACGGYTGLWSFSDNPPTLIGDGVALASRVGADLVDLEMNQYYGTDLVWPESARGTVLLYECLHKDMTGGNIYNKDGEAIFGDPLPIRDEAIKVIYKEIQAGNGGPHGGVYFDLTKCAAGIEGAKKVYGEMTTKQLRFIEDATGYNMVDTPLEVAPASHYQLGGVYINERCESSVPGLFACGEVAGNFQGDNRLAGSALCDTQTTGAKAGETAAAFAADSGFAGLDNAQVEAFIGEANKYFENKEGALKSSYLRKEVKETMTKYVSPYRSEKGLLAAKENMLNFEADLAKVQISHIKKRNTEWREALELEMMLDTAKLIIDGALFRKESRGHHFREDFPETDNKNWRKHTLVKKTDKGFEYSLKDIIYTRMPPKDGE